MKLYKNGEPVYSYEPSYGGKRIIVAIDSSKSNTAIVVGDASFNILDDYEIAGGGSDVDVYKLCWDTRDALKTLFHGSNIVLVGIENIITKKEGQSVGMDYHSSRAKITAVFDNLLFYFQDYHNIMPVLIDNQTWKYNVLPAEYRKRNHKKGSKDWFVDLDNKWAGRKDDVTDVVCIFTYMSMIHKVRDVRDIIQTTPCNHDYTVSILPVENDIVNGLIEFNVKNNDSFEHNMDSIANMLKPNEMGYAILPIEYVPINLIHSSNLKISKMFSYNRTVSKLCIVVSR